MGQIRRMSGGNRGDPGTFVFFNRKPVVEPPGVIPARLLNRWGATPDEVAHPEEPKRT